MRNTKKTTTTTEHLDSFSHMNVLSMSECYSTYFSYYSPPKFNFASFRLLRLWEKIILQHQKWNLYSHLTLRGKNQTRLFAICVPPPPQLSFLKFLCLYIKNAAWFSMQRIFLFCFSKCYSNMENHFYWPVNIYHMIIIII